MSDEKEPIDDLPGADEDGERSPRETFQQISHIAISMSFDLIDKLRFFEKETLKLSDEEVKQRTPHLASCLETLRTAYLEFSEVDF
ncbi:MAG: hypothetical protein PVF68_11100 [Acidobacteriota bacterium]